MHIDDRDKINALFSLTADWSLVSCIMSHLAPYLDDRPNTKIEYIQVQTTTGSMYRSRTVATSDIKAVHTKLEDGTVIVTTLEKIYRVTRTYALSGDKKETDKSIKQSTQPWYVYVVECSDTSYYCGITTDVTRRVHEHNHCKRGAKYTRSRRPVKLLKQWQVQSQKEAASAERRFKKLSKIDKVKVVKGTYEKPTEDQHHKRRTASD